MASPDACLLHAHQPDEPPLAGRGGPALAAGFKRKIAIGRMSAFDRLLT
jgi:hypothetical protein